MKKLESQRLLVQTELDSQRSQIERNKLGQFATPPELAKEILTYAKDLLPKKKGIQFLDPAVGTGSFFSALLHVFGTRSVGRATGFDVDRDYAGACKNIWAAKGLDVVVGDFTQASPPSEENAKYDLVICNPPYVRHHHIDKSSKTRLKEQALRAANVKLSGLAGLYCYFLALSHAWMKEGGTAGWLIPAEFLDVNYGNAIKKYLLESVTLTRIHRFKASDVQFGDALVSSAIIWFRKAPPPKDHKISLTEGGTLLKPRKESIVLLHDLQPSEKWMKGDYKRRTRSKTGGRILGDFFSIKRGIATGDNKFFILDEEKVTSLKLPKQFLRPILPSPRYLKNEIIEADDTGRLNIDNRLFVIDCRLSEVQLEENYYPLWKYLQQGKETVATRYLCSRREPWYSQEKREPAPFLCTYMGRGGEGRRSPFRFIWNRTDAIAANTYLLLYPKPALLRVFQRDPSKLHNVWMFLANISDKDLIKEGRVYGGGLHKVEPKELAQIRADSIAELLGQEIDEPTQVPLLDMAVSF